MLANEKDNVKNAGHNKFIGEKVVIINKGDECKVKGMNNGPFIMRLNNSKYHLLALGLIMNLLNTEF